MAFPIKHSRNRLFMAGLVFLLPLALLGGCQGEKPAASAPGITIPAGPDQVFIDARFVVTEGGETKAVVRADSVKVFQGQGLSLAEGNLQVELYSREGELTSTLTAERGIVYGMSESIDSLRAEDNVLVTWHHRNATMITPFIRWISGTRMIYADSTVVLSVDNAQERGVAFVAPDDLTSYSMGRVTGVIEGQEIEIPGR